ncbi:MAG TPA: PaaI family thioesterase [Steroidobacter sp.]|jgi:1,4-dihydroxy-2-naphthoyl-CoA hydrolase|nr:PaaI family thioesterase [Steroidobacter sp.]
MSRDNQVLAMTPIWFSSFTLEDVGRFEAETFSQLIGIEFTEIGSDYLAGRVRLIRNLRQPFGLLHGGVSAALAETLGSIAANFVVDRSRFLCVGQSISASHLRSVPVDGSYITAIARAASVEQDRQVWDITLRRSDDKVFCACTLTMAVLPADRFS